MVIAKEKHHPHSGQGSKNINQSLGYDAQTFDDRAVSKRLHDSCGKAVHQSQGQDFQGRKRDHQKEEDHTRPNRSHFSPTEKLPPRYLQHRKTNGPTTGTKLPVTYLAVRTVTPSATAAVAP